MNHSFRMCAKFWGVRGSIATPEAGNLGFGGNTACLEIRCGADRFVIDGGTGVRNFATALRQELASKSCELSFLMSHFHWDHIQGFPFFGPLFSPASEITFLACRDPQETERVLEAQMAPPYFPAEMAARRKYVNAPENGFALGPFTVHAFPVNHPQQASGFRIEKDGAVIVHASDLEHGDAKLDRILREHAQNADVLIMDAQYTPAEYESKKGWGHSTWAQATQVARDCNVKKLVLFHHDPFHDDAFMREMVLEARKHFDNTVAAEELSELIV